jgi:hypothetical protein
MGCNRQKLTIIGQKMTQAMRIAQVIEFGREVCQMIRITPRVAESWIDDGKSGALDEIVIALRHVVLT